MSKKTIIILLLAVLAVILAVAGYFVYNKYFGKTAVAGAPLRGTVSKVEANKVYASLNIPYQSNRDGQRIVEFEERTIIIGEETELVKRPRLGNDLGFSEATILDIEPGLFIAVNPKTEEEGKKEFTATRLEVLK